jgi:hypothetical protein
MLTAFLLFTIPNIFIFGTILRVFERPISDLTGFNYSNPFNAIWCLMMAMSTIGYGDIYPNSTMGRIALLTAAIWGLFVFSTIVAAVDNDLDFSEGDKKAYYRIN